MPILNSVQVTDLTEKKGWVWRVRLYSDDITPTFATDGSALTEIVDAGYSAQVLTIGTGQDIEFGAVTEDGDDVYMTAASPVVFNYTGATDVYLAGVTLDRGNGEEFYQVERLDDAPRLPSGSETLNITLTVRVQ